MNSKDELQDGAKVGRDSSAQAPAARRTSNAFGSPGTDSTVKRLDLNDAFIEHPEATFLMRSRGDAMASAGIADGDVLLVDRSLAAVHNSVVIASVEGELICRRLAAPTQSRGQSRQVSLVADPGVAPIDISPEIPLEVWGVVTTVIKRLV